MKTKSQTKNKKCLLWLRVVLNKKFVKNKFQKRKKSSINIYALRGEGKKKNEKRHCHKSDYILNETISYKYFLFSLAVNEDKTL